MALDSRQEVHTKKGEIAQSSPLTSSASSLSSILYVSAGVADLRCQFFVRMQASCETERRSWTEGGGGVLLGVA